MSTGAEQNMVFTEKEAAPQEVVATHEVAIVQHVVAVHGEAIVGVALDGMDTGEDLGGMGLGGTEEEAVLAYVALSDPDSMNFQH